MRPGHTLLLATNLQENAISNLISSYHLPGMIHLEIMNRQHFDSVMFFSPQSSPKVSGFSET